MWALIYRGRCPWRKTNLWYSHPKTKDETSQFRAFFSSPQRDSWHICIYDHERLNPRLEIDRQTIIRLKKKENKYTYFWCIRDNCLVEKPFDGKSIFTQVSKMKILFAECSEFVVFLMTKWWQPISVHISELNVL